MRLFITITTLLLSVFLSSAQLIEVKDENFREALCNNYPSVMTNECLLDTIKAEAVDDTSIIITNNKLSSVEGIQYFNRIDSIILSNNELPFFLEKILPATFWSLRYLDISNNNITILPHLAPNKEFNHLRYLYFQNNKIEEIQNYWGFWDTLKVINISNNYLKDFPDASRAKEAELIDISNNYLSFEDIIPQTKHTDFETVFKVFPQKEVRWVVNSYTAQERDSLRLELPIDANVSSNTYEWYQNDSLIAKTSENHLTIDSVQLQHSGTYHILIFNNNPLLKDVYLRSEEISVEITPCLDISVFSYQLTPKCYGGELFTDFKSIYGGTPPYQFMLTDKENKITELNNQDEKILKGTYLYEVEDNVGCKKTLVQQLAIYPPENCDENVITPNGDGFQDEIYFDQSGKAVIYNQFGQTINTLSLPNFWDCKDQNGNLVQPGKYIMIINDQEQVALKVLW